RLKLLVLQKSIDISIQGQRTARQMKWRYVSQSSARVCGVRARVAVVLARVRSVCADQTTTNSFQNLLTPFEAEECAELIYVHFFKGAKKQKNAEEQDILGSMNAAFLALMFTALGHALFDWAS